MSGTDHSIAARRSRCPKPLAEISAQGVFRPVQRRVLGDCLAATFLARSSEGGGLAMHTPKAHDTKTEAFDVRKRTDFIVVHCADTPAKMNIGASEIRTWHKER